MKKYIGIIIALESEAQTLLNSLNDKKVKNVNGKKYYFGKIDNKSVIIAICGLGKVSASMTTQSLIDIYKPKYILNIGTAGGIGGKVKIRNFYAISNCSQYDFDLSSLDNVKVGYIQDYDTIQFNVNSASIPLLEKRNLTTSDHFTCSTEDIKKVTDIDAEIFDMEGCAIAQTCTSNNMPVYIIKGISDTHGSENENFYDNLVAIREQIPDLIKKLVNTI